MYYLRGLQNDVVDNKPINLSSGMKPLPNKSLLYPQPPGMMQRPYEAGHSVAGYSVAGHSVAAPNMGIE
jgi:hypothetical protein